MMASFAKDYAMDGMDKDVEGDSGARTVHFGKSSLNDRMATEVGQLAKAQVQPRVASAQFGTAVSCGFCQTGNQNQDYGPMSRNASNFQSNIEACSGHGGQGLQLSTVHHTSTPDYQAPYALTGDHGGDTGGISGRAYPKPNSRRLGEPVGLDSSSGPNDLGLGSEGIGYHGHPKRRVFDTTELYLSQNFAPPRTAPIAD